MTNPNSRGAPVVLCVLDGWGVRAETSGNAVAQARTPRFDAIWAAGPRTTLAAHGADVGLPDGQMGNSEVGHTNLGAGRVVWMDLPRIDNAIADGGFGSSSAWDDFADGLRARGGVAHLMGLASPGGVHAHQRHIIACAAALSERGAAVRAHLFLDGRDTPPKSAEAPVAEIAGALAKLPDAAVATVIGRYFAMDRDNRWERVEAAYRAMIGGEGRRADTAAGAVAAAYDAGETDEFAQPCVVGDFAGAAHGDGVVMANFRSDRARQILDALIDPDFDGFVRGDAPLLAPALGMVSYSPSLDTRMPALFPPQTIVNGLGPWAASHGLRQFRAAETEKYPHVTFFFNGGVEEPYPDETRSLSPSPKVATYDLAPEMAAAEVADAVVAALDAASFDLAVVNFANPDMVGHTGDLGAAVLAVEATDAALGRVLDAAAAAQAAVFVTADHGNCETMVDPDTGGPHTAHTLNPVPAILVDARPGAARAALRDGGRLADVAPTLLALADVPKPDEMTGRSLLAPN